MQVPQPSSKAKPHQPHKPHNILFSHLDITYPYYHQSMLAKSKFYGFESLMFECGIYFSLMYIASNYMIKGYFLKWDILQTITNNFIQDVAVICLLVALGLVQIYLGHLLLKIYRKDQRKAVAVYLYCLIWLVLFVSLGLYVINTNNFYFTDRIFIVVVSWALPVKTASFCIDQITNNYKHQNTANNLQRIKKMSILSYTFFLLKFIVSPKVIYKEYLAEHCHSLKIHVSYLAIKSLVAFICLLVNYILMTEIINPLIQPESYNQMSFIELFFRLIPVAFYVNICLYYLIMENILLAMAEITQLKNRVFYEDWWNAQTVSEFLDKWVLMINSFSDTYLDVFSKRVRHTLNLIIIFLMLFSVFSNKISLYMLLFAGINILTVFLFGQHQPIQNNYIVHFLTISFTPFSIAAQLKYSFFS